MTQTAHPEITVEFESAVGPRVMWWGDESVEEIEAAVLEAAEGDYWGVDWETESVRTDSGGWSSPLTQTTTEPRRCECGEITGVRCGDIEKNYEAEAFVTVEFMPEHLRESHRQAGNWGRYPHNGAVRIRVGPECAEDLIDADEYTHEVGLIGE